MRRLFAFPSAAAWSALVLGVWISVGLTTPAHAAGWIAALKNTPAENFDDEDLRMFLDAANKTLSAEGSTEEIRWSNPATGAAGRFKELRRSETKDGRSCKRVQVWVSSKKRSEKSSVWNACKSAEGRWELSAGK